MIDLNYKPKKSVDDQEKEPCMFVQMVSLLPFAFLLWLILTKAFLHGIY